MKKRLRQPDKWEINITNKAVNSGEIYVSHTSKKFVPARKKKRTCGPECRFKCEQKINEEARDILYAYYWSIPDHSQKMNFICRYVTEEVNKEEITEGSKRYFTRIYTINNQKTRIKLCQTMFINTLHISKK